MKTTYRLPKCGLILRWSYFSGQFVSERVICGGSSSDGRLFRGGLKEGLHSTLITTQETPE